jgi:hypothetical protein
VPWSRGASGEDPRPHSCAGCAAGASSTRRTSAVPASARCGRDGGTAVLFMGFLPVRIVAGLAAIVFAAAFVLVGFDLAGRVRLWRDRRKQGADFR